MRPYRLRFQERARIGELDLKNRAQFHHLVDIHHERSQIVGWFNAELERLAGLIKGAQAARFADTNPAVETLFSQRDRKVAEAIVRLSGIRGKNNTSEATQLILGSAKELNNLENHVALMGFKERVAESGKLNPEHKERLTLAYSDWLNAAMTFGKATQFNA